MGDIESEMYWIFLSCVEGLGDVQTDRLLQVFGGAKEIFTASELELYSVEGVYPRVIEEILKLRKNYEPERVYDDLYRKGISYVSRQNPDYPKRLLAIGNPPNGLFYIGKLPDSSRPAIAIVGSRSCTNYGRDMAIEFGKGLSRAGVDVISGMAAGVDGYSHRGALNGGGDTYAILGTGVDICFPSSNIDIYERIKQQGGVISEYAPGTPGKAVNFPRRNRIISALSDGVLVVEAREKSGTWITVDMGLEQGKDIYVIPGRITDPLSFGCNRLVRQGARLVLSPADIVAELAPHYGFMVARDGCGDYPGEDKKAMSMLKNSEKKVLKLLDTRPVTIDDLSVKTGLSVPEIMTSLTMLEVRGFVEKVSGVGYVKRII